MRALIVTLALAGGLAIAGPAAAQMSTPSSMITPPPQGTGEFTYNRDDIDPVTNQQSRYDFQVMMLKKKMDRLTKADGGQLTPQHQASLQTELDKLNRAFGHKVAQR